MKTKDGFIQGYNAQAAVDATAQVIVAHGLDARQNDQHQLTPIADAIRPSQTPQPLRTSRKITATVPLAVPREGVAA